ncbi:MAG: LuxR C-terminal-related transcriptional regulator [Anaerolineae bacterium]
MPTQILATKLYVPPPRPQAVLRPHLIERLDEGLAFGCNLTLISAAAGFGKTTLLSEWVAGCGRPVAWLSLDREDSEPARFLTYLVAALQTVAPDMGAGVLAALESPQPPRTEPLLTALLNEIATIPDPIILVLDDWHAIDSEPAVPDGAGRALAYIVDHLPPRIHLVIATREDPVLPLARLRARGRLTELRAADLRFTPAEAAAFLNQVMGLALSAEDIAALESRTEGWIAGLQLAALSMRGQESTASFIQSFTGSHHFVLDYLLEEVLHRQSESIQAFLLRTSILERLCGPLCDAVLASPTASGQATLEYLERANLFIVPLDSERRWYRYHHLFGELLRQRLGQTLAAAETAALHIRASAWYEDNGLAFESFHHAAEAGDVARAERLIEARKLSLYYRSVATPVLAWLTSLPKATLDARPRLWVRSATLALMAGQTAQVEGRLQAAEAAFAAKSQGPEAGEDAETRDLFGQMACARAILALTRYDPKTMIVQARLARELLLPDNLVYRFDATWVLASAYLFLGDRAAAAQAARESMALAQVSRYPFSLLLATQNLARVQELNNEFHEAAASYRRVLELAGEHPQPNAGESHLGLARIHYEWNDLEQAEQHGKEALRLLRQFDSRIDRAIRAEVFLARLELARGDLAGVAAMLAETERSVRENNFALRMPDVAEAQVLVLLRQGNLEAAARLGETHALPLCRARVHLAGGDPAAALALLEPLRLELEAKDWQAERLQVLMIQAMAIHALGQSDDALQVLGQALALAEPGGFVRLFIDEGAPMARLLTEAAEHGMVPQYVARLRTAFDAEERRGQETPAPPTTPAAPPPQSGIEPLSPRELEVLRLVAQGLSNREISQRLFLALSTVKGHNLQIFAKLQVQRRTEAVARARELGLL